MLTETKTSNLAIIRSFKSRVRNFGINGGRTDCIFDRQERKKFGTMPQLKRHKRLKRISSKQKFGVRYLHQHMFNDEPTSDEDLLQDTDDTPTQIDGRLYFVRCVSCLMVFAGIVFALVGGLVKRRDIDYRVTKDGEQEPIGDAVQYNSMLDAFVLVGGVLMMLGGMMLAAVQILVCYPRRKLGTKKPRAKDPENFLYRDKKSESEVASQKLEKVPVFALVHKVQPKKREESNIVDKSSSSKKNKVKTSFDEQKE